MRYYTYKITFVDGHYYYGSRRARVSLEEDIYWGSPKTHKNKWNTTMYFKTILCEYNTYEECVDAEIALIKPVYKTDVLCLNVGCGRRVNMTAEVREKLRKARQGIPLTQETRDKLAAANRGRKLTPEACEKVSASKRGKKRPPQVGAAVAEANRKRIWTEERRANMSRTPSQETKDKISAAQKGKPKPRKQPIVNQQDNAPIIFQHV